MPSRPQPVFGGLQAIYGPQWIQHGLDELRSTWEPGSRVIGARMDMDCLILFKEKGAHLIWTCSNKGQWKTLRTTET